MSLKPQGMFGRLGLENSFVKQLSCSFEWTPDFEEI